MIRWTINKGNGSVLVMPNPDRKFIPAAKRYLRENSPTFAAIVKAA